MNFQWTSWIRITACVTSATLLIGVTGCGRRTASDDSQADDSRSEPGVVDVITGKAAVDAGQRAKDAIRESSEMRNRQLDESLEW